MNNRLGPFIIVASRFIGGCFIAGGLVVCSGASEVDKGERGLMVIAAVLVIVFGGLLVTAKPGSLGPSEGAQRKSECSVTDLDGSSGKQTRSIKVEGSVLTIDKTASVEEPTPKDKVP